MATGRVTTVWTVRGADVLVTRLSMCVSVPMVDGMPWSPWPTSVSVPRRVGLPMFGRPLSRGADLARPYGVGLHCDRAEVAGCEGPAGGAVHPDDAAGLHRRGGGDPADARG